MLINFNVSNFFIRRNYYVTLINFFLKVEYVLCICLFDINIFFLRIKFSFLCLHFLYLNIFDILLFTFYFLGITSSLYDLIYIFSVSICIYLVIQNSGEEMKGVVQYRTRNFFCTENQGRNLDFRFHSFISILLIFVSLFLSQDLLSLCRPY